MGVLLGRSRGSSSSGGSSSSPESEQSSTIDVNTLRSVEGSVEVGQLHVVLQHAVDQALELRSQLGGRVELVQVDQSLLANKCLTH